MPATASKSDVSSTHTVSFTLKLSATLTVIWVLSLIGMAMLTANPVLINRQQFVEADIIVTGLLSDVSTKRGMRSAKLRVKIVHKAADPNLPDQLNVNLPEELEIDPEQTYIVPLTHIHADLYRITPTKAGYKLSAIYPNTAEVQSQLAEIVPTAQ